MAYVTDKALKTEINSLMVKVDNNFAKKKQAIKSIELVKSIPTGSTSTEKVNCLRLYYVDHETKTDTTTGELIPHYIDISVADLGGFKLNKWEKDTEYKTGDYVVYDNSMYLCITDHTSSTDFKTDIANWELYIGGSSEEVPLWEVGKDYKVNDRVTYTDGNVYKCIVDHTSADFDTEKDNWIIELNHYYNLSKDQYDLMVTNGLINDSNKNLYIVNDDVNPLGEEYNETISSATNEWIITHGLKCQYPRKIYVFDDGGNEIVLPTIEYKTENMLIISFDIPISGSVKIIK